MGAAVWAGGLRVPRERLLTLEGDVRKVAVAGLAQIASEGVEEMKGYIEDRGVGGTRWVEYRLNQGRGTTGRHDSGDMVEAVKSDLHFEKTSITAEVGWVDEYKPYFGFQEDGTGQIEPMFALRDMASTARAKFRALGKTIYAKALRR